MFGEIANVSVGGMLRLLSIHRQTGRLKVRGEDGEGEIYLHDGQVVGSSQAKVPLRGEVLRLLLLRKGYFHFENLDAIPAKHRQGEESEVENLIIEASRQCDPAEAAEYLPPEEAVLQLAPIANERESIRLAFLREEWNVLTHINGEDSLAMLIEKSRIQPGRTRQILFGLLSAGVIRKTRFRIPQVLDIATRELGNMGEALVRQAFRKLKLDQSRMHMRELIRLLNELEGNITLLLGPTRAKHIIGLMWEGAKR